MTIRIPATRFTYAIRFAIGRNAHNDHTSVTVWEDDSREVLIFLAAVYRKPGERCLHAFTCSDVAA